ncbi:rad51 family DNA repair protein [Pseudohyphozyma bogoriensis]|nr:rad51 family DNA repair protein [Pseudohyphozyma bogoriensis]
MDIASTISTCSGLEVIWQLLSSVLYTTSPPGASYISGLDALFDRSAGLNRGDVIEISGVASSGKTQLLYFLAMTALLPERWEVELGGVVVDAYIGGKGKSVVWMDATQRFDINRLTSLLQTHLTAQVNAVRSEDVLAPAPSTILEQVQLCLENLHVFTPSSTSQLAISVLRLPEYFTNLENDHSPEIGYLIIDGMSEFTSSDQLAREKAKDDKGKGRAEDQSTSSTSTPTTAAHTNSPSTSPPLHLLLAAIARVRTTLSPVTVYTTWVHADSRVAYKSQSGLPFFPPSLPLPWPQITSSPPPFDPSSPLAHPPLPTSQTPTFSLAYHITTYPRPMTKFPQGTRLGTALKERKNGRGEGMEGFVAVVRGRGGKEVGQFEFDVLDGAVHG